MESLSTDPAVRQLAVELDELERDRQVGYQGDLKLLKVMSLPIFQGSDGKLYVMDLARAKSGVHKLSVREWITVRGDQAGGRESVEPGSKNLGVLDLGKAILGGGGNPLNQIALQFFRELVDR